MKNKVKKLVSICCLIGVCISIKAQQATVSETLTKVEAYYKTAKTFNLDVEYAMYKGYTGTYPTESYKSKIHKKDEITKIDVMGSEIIQFPEVQLIINKENKTINYNKISDNALQQSPMNVSSFLKFYKEVSSEVSGNTIIHELVVKNKQLPIPYNKIILHINKDNYSIKKQVLYLSTKVPFVDENGINTEDVGRMVITFKTSSTIVKTPKLQDYVILESNKKPRLAKAYTTYNIIDQSNI